MKKIILTIFILSICVKCFAAPTLSSFNNDTIEGLSFGNAPDIVFFDDFEGGSSGSDLTTGNAVVGDYSVISETAPYYTNTAAVSGNLAFQVDQSLGFGNGAQVAFTDTTELFVSYNVFIPLTDNVPGEGGTSINWKIMWILGGDDTVTNDKVIPVMLAGTPSNDFDKRIFAVAGNDQDPAYTKYMNSPALDFNKGAWSHIMVWYKGGWASDGEVLFQQVVSDNGVENLIDDTGLTNLTVSGSYNRVAINAYGRQTDNCHPTFDDVYIAKGANAKARVIVGDNSTYANSTKIAMQVADKDKWTATSITILYYNQGVFDNYETAYLFVVDSDGTASDGYQGYFVENTFYPSGTGPVASASSISGAYSITGACNLT